MSSKKKDLRFIVLFVVIVGCCLIYLFQSSYARYRRGISGNVSSDIASWNIKVNGEDIANKKTLTNTIEPTFLESENIFLRFKKEDKAIICYFHEVIDRLEKENIITFYSEIRGENSLFIYQFNDNKDIFIIKGLVGEPLIGGFIHLLITNGLKNILFIGGGGSLIPSNVGDLVLIDGAIRDEGFSFFYEPPSRIIYSNKDIVIKIENELRRKNIPY